MEKGISMRMLFVLLCILSIVATQVYAADPPTIQNSVERIDPGKTASEIMQQEPLPEQIQPPLVNLPAEKPANLPDDSGTTVKFTLKQIVLSGNTIFSTAELTPLYADKLNTEVSLADLHIIARKITDYYRASGYILSQAIIPPQEIDYSGVVKIKVIEGYISKVSISGCKTHSICCLLQGYGEHISKQKPLNIINLERYSFLASDIPGAKVKAVLTRSQEHLGAADLTFLVEEQTLGGSFAFNNYNTEVMGRQQLLGNIYINNIAPGSQTNVNGIVTRNSNRMQYIALSHQQQLNSYGLGGRFAVSNINTTPDMGTIGLGGLDIPGKAFIFTAGLDYAYLRSHNRNINIGGGFKLLNSTTEFGNETLFKDNIRSLNIYAAYDFLQSINTANTIIVTFTQGLKIFNAQGNPPSRVGEDLTFSKIDLYASSLHRFSNSKFSSFLALKAQYGFNLLPSSETFNYGGVPFGYGYDPSEFSGDRGLAGLIELRYPFIYNRKLNLFSHIFAFFDFGYVWDIHTNVVPTYQNGASTGLGTRFNMLKHVKCDFIVGAPLKNSQIAGTPNFVRVLFNLKIYA